MAAGLSKGEHMFKKAILGVAIVLVLVAAGVTVAAASSKSADASKHRVQTIQLVAKQTQDVLLVLAAPGHGPVGNQFLTTDDLYRQGHKVGHDASICQFMADLGQAGGRFQCVATLSLPEGQLTTQGLITLTETGGQPVTLAITGGTGAYRTAHGQAQVVQVSETEARYTLTVIT
jgi:Allene oxide cyclase barrel like domain